VRLAIIPARGGSKRIPRKNVRPFCGKPMLAWSVEAARASACFDRIVVSTDDPDISQVARGCGAEVPFIRPPSLSDDHTPTVPVIQHAIQWYAQQGMAASYVCCIYATAPFVTAEDLRRGFAALNDSGSQFAVSVTTYAFPIQRALRLTAAGRIRMVNPENLNVRSQDLEETYHDAGQFYWGRAAGWLAGAPLLGGEAVPVILPRHRVQDIDTPEDWARAEAMFKSLQPLGE